MSTTPPPLPATSVATRRPKRRLWVYATIAIVVLLGGFVAFRVARFGLAVVLLGANVANTPTKPDDGLTAAAKLIASARGGTAHGNTAEARTIAAKISTDLWLIRETLFDGGDKDSLDIKAITKGKFIVFCQMNQDTCAVLIHVPELKRFTATAKESIAALAYIDACKALPAAYKPQLRRLAVATRGNMLFDRSLIGETGFAEQEPAVHAKTVLHTALLPAELKPFFPPATAGQVLETPTRED